MLSNWDKNEEILIFREYLRIPTVEPNADYRKMFSRMSKLIYITKSFIYRASYRFFEGASSQSESANCRSLSDQ